MNLLSKIIRRALGGYLNHLRDAVYADALNHGLWAGESAYGCAMLISDEVDELMEASCDPHAFEEELADVIIMALSVAGYLKIDIHEAVARKIAINVTRPYRHEVVEK